MTIPEKTPQPTNRKHSSDNDQTPQQWQTLETPVNLGPYLSHAQPSTMWPKR
jgi:hypothetical protein